jgi:hypothetical protein
MRFDFSNVLREQRIKAKLMGIVFIVMGVYLIATQEQIYIKIGFGAIFIGLFAIFVITEKAVPQKLNEAQLLSNMELLRSLSANLNLEGNGVYIPATGNLTKEKVFIPLQEDKNYTLSTSEDIFFVTNLHGSSLGVIFPPPGLALLDIYEKEMNIKIKSITFEELEQRFQMFCRSMGLLKNLSLKKDDEVIIVKITHSRYKDLCQRIRMDMSDICRQVCCPLCSLILCALTRALGTKVRIQHVESKNNTVELTLKTE